jgi:hypothetical protein
MNSTPSHSAPAWQIRGLKGFLRASLVPVFLVIIHALSYGQADTLIQGVRISFQIADKMFPCSWYKKKIGAEAISLATAEVPRAERILDKAFAKYPESFLTRYLEKVWVLKSMKFYGYPFGGTYTKKKIYLAFDEENTTNTDQYMEQRFHQELSSILWRENHRKLDLASWYECNPRGFLYGEGGAVAIAYGTASMDTDPGYFNIGFLNRYAMTEVEQDINVIAQNLFAGGPEFWKIVDSNPGIRGKALLLIGFYHSLDPVFTESYFRGL